MTQKIFTAQDQKALDLQTIKNEPISSLNLMYQASEAFTDFFMSKFNKEVEAHIYCGVGNNGGDGLVIATLLHQYGYDVQVIISSEKAASSDYKNILERAKKSLPTSIIHRWPNFSQKSTNSLAIDAIFGIGLNRPLEEPFSELVSFINTNYCDIVSVDIPTGMYADKSPKGHDQPIIHSSQCYTFNAPKLSFFLPESEPYIKKWDVIPIGISQAAITNTETTYFYSKYKLHELSIHKRDKYSHKGTFGHGLLWAGSRGMYGAAILAAKASMRSGIGKLSVHSTKKGLIPIQASLPEVLFEESKTLSNSTNYNAIAIGPGIRASELFLKKYNQLTATFSHVPFVLDAGALTILSGISGWEELIPKKAILTPHPKEYDRLASRTFKCHLGRIKHARNLAQKHKFIIILKGAHTAVCHEDGKVYFNTSGNTALATAGSGDVLTGILLAFLSQGIEISKAAQESVFLHGKLGEIALKKRNAFSVIASDLIESLGK